MHRYAHLAAALCCCGGVTACETQGGRGESTTYLHTEPSATCTLNGRDFERVVQTPNSVRLPHSAAPLAVACKSEGYTDAVATLDTGLDTQILGGFLFGGIFGMTGDGTRGVGRSYPARVVLTLAPLAFATAAERDAWFDRRKADLDARWAEALAELRDGQTCRNPVRIASCNAQVRIVEQRRDAERAELEGRRAQAEVAEN